MTKVYGYDTNIYETSIGNIKCFNESCSKEDLLFYPSNELIEMILQLQSNWNSLREYVEELYNKEGSWAVCGARYVLDKMNELEGKDNDE